MIPLFATIGVSKLVVESKQSQRRIELLEKDRSAVEKLSTLLREMEHGIENALVETVEDPGVDDHPDARDALHRLSGEHSATKLVVVPNYYQQTRRPLLPERHLGGSLYFFLCS